MTADTTIILLAAGASSRMRGADKMLEPVEDVPLLRVMAGRAQKAGALRVVLPLGNTARAQALDGLTCEIVTVPAGQDMSASLAAGVRGLAGPVLIVLADMPDVTAHDMHLMIALSAQAPRAILRAAAQDGTPGNPVLFPADMLAELHAIKGDKGARDLLQRHSARVHLIPLPGQNALTDLDTPQDWAAWRATQPYSTFGKT
jgi:molybdenum cofactor cytidylyltransferase